MERLQRQPPYPARGVGPDDRQPRVVGKLPLQRISCPRRRNPRNFGAQFRREAKPDRMNEELFSMGLVNPPTLHRVKARFAKTTYCSMRARDIEAEPACKVSHGSRPVRLKQLQKHDHVLPLQHGVSCFDT